MSRPEPYDAIVIGSGFGAAVSACRLAQGGWSVLVLERGRAYPPGSFPRSPYGLARGFWDPDEDLYGMFDIWSFHRLDGVVSSGLGGGSLIYANVMLRKDENWFVTDGGPEDGWEHWPVTRADLDPHYDRVEEMLGATPYPLEHEPYASTPKTLAYRDAAGQAGLKWSLPNLAVTFAGADGNPVPGAPVGVPADNLHGLPRSACTLCGECDIGCNVGAKDTLDHTYLSAAQRAGAEILTCCEAKTLARGADGLWEVGYVVHDNARRGHATEPAAEGPGPHPVRARHVVVGAGVFGTALFLQRNGAALPGISRRLGDRICANGDLLSFAVRTRDADGRPRHLHPSRGPVITSMVRVPDGRDGNGAPAGQRGHYVQDAGYPALLEWVFHAVDIPRELWEFRHTLLRRILERFKKERDANVSAELSALLGSGRTSAAMMPLLGMGRDIPGGRLRLNGSRLECNWNIDESATFFADLQQTCRRLAEELGGDFIDTAIGELDRIVTVHPLGGCAMSRSPEEGVVDAWGEVHGLPGLHVADGSVMPGPVGPNPSLTIAALAERFAAGMLEPELKGAS